MDTITFFIPQGMVIGERIARFSDDKQITIKNPSLVITRQNEILLIPLLHLIEEDTITLLIEDLAFKQIFTPKIELSNHYNKIFGSGIVVTNILPV